VVLVRISTRVTLIHHCMDANFTLVSDSIFQRKIHLKAAFIS
jgi:hypothetical protein